MVDNRIALSIFKPHLSSLRTLHIRLRGDRMERMRTVGVREQADESIFCDGVGSP
jgi:hypothetical protein